MGPLTLNQRVAGSSPARLILDQYFGSSPRTAFLLSALSSALLFRPCSSSPRVLLFKRKNFREDFAFATNNSSVLGPWQGSWSQWAPRNYPHAKPILEPCRRDTKGLRAATNMKMSCFAFEGDLEAHCGDQVVGTALCGVNGFRVASASVSERPIHASPA